MKSAVATSRRRIPRQGVLGEAPANPCLTACVVNGDVSGVSMALADGENPDSLINLDATHSSVTCLHYASSRGQLGVVRELLRYGADVDLRTDNRGYTALHFATIGGHVQVVTMLLKAGADVHARDLKLSATPLEMAVSLHGADLAHLLIEAGANPNDCDANGFPFLHLAYISHGYNIYHSAMHLVQHFGLDINQRSRFGHTLLDHAARAGDVAGISDLIQLGASGGYKDPLLFLASRACKENPAKNRLEVFYRLFELGSDIFFHERRRGRNALHCLAEITPLRIKHHDEVFCKLAQTLVASGIPIDDSTSRGTTALMIASTKGNVSLVQCLLDMHAKPELVDNSGYTALHLAVQKDNTEVVKCLLQHRANPNICDVGRTAAPPLVWACGQGSLNTVKLLLQNNADVTKGCTGSNFSPLQAAAREGKHDIVKLLLKYIDTYMGSTTSDDTSANVTKGFGNRTKSRRKSRFGKKPALDQAAEQLKKEEARRKAQSQVLDDAEKLYGFTALHYAAQHGHERICDELIQAGCNVNAVDFEGYTAYDHAVYYGHAFASEVLSKYTTHYSQEYSAGAQHMNAPTMDYGHSLQRGESFNSFDSFESDNELQHKHKQRGKLFRGTSTQSLDSSISNGQ